ncbi:uncharacterized protein K452DRAFT_301685 [Aplosporella prunicola CBS 121167]|uniref:Heterokaryon incompatibility domain-containing protein n=1 Tax=Aplosporella prunicola CBS 121167 TaxID=1176127 RepID=A0A6A6B0Z8_9PEZI|nr:uncharacterized protein K452DRAFT_301685 [Aplosporella prunicola CBS 121167]KAF2137710.1 hypothetical protein K452DRAFT_301685 [Aplosporella prunicola CBS 121167]
MPEDCEPGPSIRGPNAICSRRSEPLSVANSSGSSDSNSSAVLYLITDPVPTDVNHVKFTIESHDQGGISESSGIGRDPRSWTWFEACIFRPKDIVLSGPLQLEDSIVSDPTEFAELIHDLGWEMMVDESSNLRLWHLQRNKAEFSEWQRHVITWSRDTKPVPDTKPDPEENDGIQNGEGFVEILQPGDRIGVWARAQHSGRCNNVRYAEVQCVEDTESFTRSSQEKSLRSELPGANNRALEKGRSSSDAEDDPLLIVTPRQGSNDIENDENPLLRPDLLARFVFELGSEHSPMPEVEKSEAVTDPNITALLMDDIKPAEPPIYEHYGLSPFQYKPLPDENHIRVLKILRNEEGLIHCTMKNISMQDELHARPYHCLSYTWGNPHADGNFYQTNFEARAKGYQAKEWPIVCDGQLLLVHKNLYDALNQMPKDAWANRLNRKDKDGRSLIHFWAETGGEFVPSNEVDKSQAFQALARLGQDDIVGSTLAAGADINVLDAQGKSVLHYAAANGKLGILQSLVKAGVDINHEDDNGQTALELAAEGDHIDVVSYLMEILDIRDSEQTAVEPVSLPERPDDWIWIDAICINQEDSQEKASQIAIMDAIYSEAAFIKVWLGESDAFTETAVTLVNKLDAASGKFEKSDIIPYGMNENQNETFLKANLPVIRASEWLALGGLYRRQWFRRAWVFQELVSANDVVMFCGEHEISFRSFVEISRSLLERQQQLGIYRSTWLIPPHEPAYPLELNFCEMATYNRLRAEAIYLDSKHARERFSMANLLEKTRCLSSTVAHDKIYALAGLAAHRNPKFRFRADYETPVAKLYTVVARSVILETQSLGVLNDCMHSLSGTPALPSWVPDYSLTISMCLPAIHKACGALDQPSNILFQEGSIPLIQLPWHALQFFQVLSQNVPEGPIPAKYQPELIGSITQNLSPLNWDTLRLQAAVFDKIKYEPRPRSTKANAMFRLDPLWFDLVEKLDIKYHTGEGRYEALWRTLCTNCKVPSGEPPDESYGKQFRDLICALVCGEAQYRALRYKNGDLRSYAMLEALIASSMGKHHVVRAPSTDGSVNGPYFQELKPLIEHIERLVATEPDATSCFPTAEGIRNFGLYSPWKVFTDDGKVDPKANQPGFNTSFARVYRRRRIFVTEKKYIGLGPSDLEVGDVVALIPGCKTPMLLREEPVGEEESEGQQSHEEQGRHPPRYRAVGECYVHGIMQGEAVRDGQADFRTVDLV